MGAGGGGARLPAYFAPAASHLEHLVVGKWPRRQVATRHLRRTTRLRRCGAAVPDRAGHRPTAPVRYAAAGEITQRLAEAVLAGCLPLAPPGILGSRAIVPSALHVRPGHDVMQIVTQLADLVGSAAHAALLAECLTGLESFRLSRHLDTLDTILERLSRARPSTPTGAWAAHVQAALEQADAAPMLHIAYEQLAADPFAVVSRAADWLGIPPPAAAPRRTPPPPRPAGPRDKVVEDLHARLAALHQAG